MAKKKRGDAHAGGHGWYVSFADLMGLMMSFFVMLVAFSNQDAQKLKLVAGSMRDAFGVQNEARYSGIIETDGLPTRAYFAGRRVEHAEPRRPRQQAPFRRQAEDRPRVRAGCGFAPSGVAGHAGADRDIQAHHVRGDQAGPQSRDRRPGRPFDVSRRLEGAVRTHAAVDPEAREAAARHAAAHLDHRSHRGRLDAFDLSADRANAVRQILEKEGLPTSHIFMAAGKADNEPLFPDDPTLAANRRVTITLMRESPPLPPDLKP
jgi:chemotaxis protein MotB